jgi:hypothetical protein
MFNYFSSVSEKPRELTIIVTDRLLYAMNHMMSVILIIVVIYLITSCTVDGKISVAIVCLMKDNEDILQFWLEYHSALVGVENIAILDNFSRESSRTPTILREWQEKGLKVEWEQGPYLVKGKLTHAAFQKHFPDVDVGIPLDIDEIVTGFKNGSPMPTKRAFHMGIQQFWKRSIGCGAFTQYYPTCCNDVSDTIETIDRVIKLEYEVDVGKKLFRIGEVKEIDHGNHHVILKNGEQCEEAPRSLGLMHFHHRNPRLTLEHALTDLKGFGYIDDSVTPENVQQFITFFKSLVEEHVEGAHKADEVIGFIDRGYSSLMLSCFNESEYDNIRMDTHRIGNISTILSNLHR